MTVAENLLARMMSIEEWANLSEDESGEWESGYLIEEEMPSFLHELIVGWLIQVLRVWAKPQQGLVAASGVKFSMSRDRGRMPDVTVFLRGTAFPPKSGLIRTPPTIAIEVVTPTPRDGLRDRVTKLKEYAEFGIRYYWLVDPALRSLEILELGADGRYAHAVAQSEGQVLMVPGCPGLLLDLDDLWHEVDMLDKTEQ